ncbi:MAG TPA: transglycosylase SLT domain-containing protein, partial [Roseococcus sp.]|nr:transglycosylase SLT domain-containing protein [Roseococcus sp.]
MPEPITRHAARSAMPPAARSVAALALAGLLAACGNTASGPATGGGSSYASASRSYDPPGPRSDPWGPYIREASRRFDVPEAWIREVMRQESGGRPTATSPVGAMGLMQVMPGTYRELRARHNLGDDPYHPYDSLMAGTAYIRQMYDLYGSPAFLVAYNAGPRRLENYLYNNGGMPNETRNYVARVGPGVLRASPVRRAPAEVYAAAEIPLSVPAGPRRMDAGTRMAIAEARALREQNAQFASTPAPESFTAPTRMASAVPYASPAPRARGGVVAMEPIPDGSTPEGAMALAASAARQNAETAPAAAMGGEVLPNGSILMARMDPIPDGSTPEGAARLAEANREPPQRPEPAAFA